MATASKAKKKTVRIASGLKRARQDIKLNAANTALRSRFRTVIKNVQKAVDAGDKAKAAELFKTAQPVIDSVADKNLFHKNKAARHKSRLAAKVKALATAADRLQAGPRGAAQERPALRAFFMARRAAGSTHDELVVAREVHDEVPRHRLDLAQRVVDEDALDAADEARLAVRRVADEGGGAAGRAFRPKARHRAGQPLGPVARAKGLAVAGPALDEEFSRLGHAHQQQGECGRLSPHSLGRAAAMQQARPCGMTRL